MTVANPDAAHATVSLIKTAEATQRKALWHQRLQDRLRAQEAVRLRATGHTFDFIAEALGYYDRSTAHRAVRQQLERVEAKDADDLRATADAGLVYAMTMLEPAVALGDPKAIAEYRRLIESRRRMFGLDAPIRVDHTVRDKVSAEIEALSAQLGLNDVTDHVEMPATLTPSD